MKRCEVETVLEKTRKLFEENKIDKELLASLYREYSGIEDHELFVSRAGKVFPKLNCGLTSVYLKHKLGAGEIVRGKYDGKNHTFLLFEDGKIVDITADQYGGPKVYYGPLKKPWAIFSS